jgi:hypothetical protein
LGSRLFPVSDHIEYTVEVLVHNTISHGRNQPAGARIEQWTLVGEETAFLGIFEAKIIKGYFYKFNFKIRRYFIIIPKGLYIAV